MTKIGSTNNSRQKRTTHEVPKKRPTKFHRAGLSEAPDNLRLCLAVASSDIAVKEIALWKMCLQPLPSHKNPLTEFGRASSVVPWIALLGRKVLAVPATSAAPKRMFSAAGNIMTKKRARLTCNHLEELIYLYEVWPKVREWTAINKLVWFSGYMSPTRAHTHTQTYTLIHKKTFWVVFPVSSLWQTINAKKENAFMSQTPSPCWTSIWTTPHDQVCILIPPHQHIRMSGFLPCFPLNILLSRSNPNLS